LAAQPVNALEKIMKEQIRLINKARELHDDEDLELLLDEVRVPRILQEPAG